MLSFQVLTEAGRPEKTRVAVLNMAGDVVVELSVGGFALVINEARAALEHARILEAGVETTDDGFSSIRHEHKPDRTGGGA